MGWVIERLIVVYKLMPTDMPKWVPFDKCVVWFGKCVKAAR